MKILLMHPHDIFSHNEPWTIRVVSLAREFRDMGHQVKLAYCPISPDKKDRHVELEDIGLITLTRKAGLINLLRNISVAIKAARWADVVHFQKCFHYVAVPAACF